MGLDYEYFKNQKHITDLKKLSDEKLRSLIYCFYDEKANFNKSEGFQLKGLIKACNEMEDLIKDFRFILNGYMDVINENNLSFCSKSDIEHLLTDLDNIEKGLKKIKAVRLLEKRVNELVDSYVLKIRVFDHFLNDFLHGETYLWD